MKARRLLRILASWVGLLVILLVIVFLLANLLVRRDSDKTVEDVARSQCIKDGYPADKMLKVESRFDNGAFGFGGTATFWFVADTSRGPDGKPKMEPLVLHVELRRRMNLSALEVVSIKQEPDLPDYLRPTGMIGYHGEPHP